MKRAKAGLRKSGRGGPEAFGTAFARGFVVTGLLTALKGGGRSGRDVLRFALQGGAALAAGTVAAEALGRRDYAVAVAAVAAGAVGIVVAEALTSLTSGELSIEDKEAEGG